jgi:hypothetical protein
MTPDFPGPAEVRAADLARAVVAQSDALDRQKATAAAAEAAASAQVTGPGDPPSKAELRQWALAKAVQDGHAVIRPGGKPTLDLVAMLPSGPVVYRGSSPPVLTVYGPENAAEEQAGWDARIRAEDDQLLIAAYGVEACREAGLL